MHYFVHLRNEAVNGRSTAAPPAEADAVGTTSRTGEARSEAHVLRGVTGVVASGKIMAILGELALWYTADVAVVDLVLFPFAAGVLSLRYFLNEDLPFY